ncbi:MAG: AI-2E family transporter [Bacteroidales bacterium]|nr:AI-2E family transporter [Bacteroidales bacterium]
MEKNTATERLATYLIGLGVLTIVGVTCWYFREVILYILLAVVVSLLGQPLVGLLGKIHIKGKSAPKWVLAILSIVIILGAILLLFTQFFPFVKGILKDASLFSGMKMPKDSLVENVNAWVIGIIPGCPQDFDAFSRLTSYLNRLMGNIDFSTIVGSVASAITSLGIGIFSVSFISFFFIKDDQLFSKIVKALTPDRLEESVTHAINDIQRLLSRYFVGLVMEMACIAVIDTLGLWLIARIGFGYAVGIGIIAGILNIIPYVGPLIGEGLGVILCVVLKTGAGVGLDVNIWVFALIVLAIMLFAQLIDNFVLQPVIYSSSIQATPLEIFIVILMGGHIGGALGMLAAIPTYTVIRVIAGRFFYDKKPVRMLMPGIEHEQ